MKNVLIVDDEEAVRISIRYIANLEKQGITGIFEASNGIEAKEILRSKQIDILLTDIYMPYEDGISLMDFVHKNYPRIKIIVISGYQDFEYAVGAMRNGALDYLLKPIDPDKLNKVLSEALEPDSTEEEQLPTFQKIKDYLDQNYDKNINLDDLSKKFGFNASYLSRRFKQLFGKGVIEYSVDLKMKKAKEMLLATDLLVFDISQRLGYSDEKYFSRVFSREEGVGPSKWREIQRRNTSFDKALKNEYDT